MAKASSTLILVLGIFGAVVVDACFKKFSNEQEFGKAMTVCMKNLSITADTMPKTEDYMTGDYDDRVSGKGFLSGFILGL